MSCSDDDPKLPQVLVEEILKRLPVRDLLRFRCVSKLWRSTVDDPRFVALHLSHSKWYVAGLYSLYPDRERVDREKERKLYSLFPSERPSLSPIEIPFASRRNHYGIVGSCNGLICVKEIHRYGQTMYLWNLFTRKHKAVPVPGPERGFLFTESARLVSGFCFDARSNDYKIVSFLCNKSRLHGVKPPKPPVAIYSLRTGCWRSLECEVPAFSNHKPAVFLNGNLHWPGYTYIDQREETMVLFDVVGEVFDEMAIPQEVSLVNTVGFAEWCVAVLDDSLAVLIAREDGHPEFLSFCSVWVMEEYGKPESWTWRYSFRACSLVTDVDGITRNGEHLLQIEEDREVSWNRSTGHFTYLPFPRLCEVVSVAESLVSF